MTTKWAAGRQPDIEYKGRKIWRVPHDRERGVLLQFWYTEAGPTSEDGFDVRCLPGYVEQRFPSLPNHGWREALRQREAEQQAYHAEIIRRAIDAEIDLVETAGE
jgi:hypothetical protein